LLDQNRVQETREEKNKETLAEDRQVDRDVGGASSGRGDPEKRRSAIDTKKPATGKRGTRTESRRSLVKEKRAQRHARGPGNSRGESSPEGRRPVVSGLKWGEGKKDSTDWEIRGGGYTLYYFDYCIAASPDSLLHGPKRPDQK